MGWAWSGALQDWDESLRMTEPAREHWGMRGAGVGAGRFIERARSRSRRAGKSRCWQAKGEGEAEVFGGMRAVPKSDCDAIG